MAALGNDTMGSFRDNVPMLWNLPFHSGIR